MASVTGKRSARRRRSKGRSKAAFSQLPWRTVRSLFPPVELISTDELTAIHQTSLSILEEIGMDFLLPEARDRLQQAGADVQGERVRIDRHLVEQAIATAPSSFTLHARNQDHDLEMGGDILNVCSVGSAPNASDLEGGRRQVGPGCRAVRRARGG